MAVKVFFIAKIKDFNNEYKDYVKRVRDLGEAHDGFISLENEEIGDLETKMKNYKRRNSSPNIKAEQNPYKNKQYH